MLWSRKHRPQKLSEFCGNEEACEEALKWAREFERGKIEKPLLLHGPSGIGKTCLAETLAKEMGWGVVEANAGDLRDAETMQKIFGISSSSSGLLGVRRLLLIDEVDAARDRGEFQALAQIIRETSQPIIFTANDLWEKSLSAIRLACRPLEMKKVNARSVSEVLKRIAKHEGADISDEEVTAIARGSSGDLRGAINDLQAACSGRGKCEIATGSRERETGAFDAVRHVLKAETYAGAIAAADGLDEEPETLLLWIAENVPNEYEDAGEVARAYGAISRASVFFGRVKKTRDWGFLKYARSQMLAGVALAKAGKYYKFSKYGFPSAIRSLGASKKSREILKSASKAVGAATHSSAKKARQGTLPFLAPSASAAARFGLEEEDLKQATSSYGTFPKHKTKK
ncbi:MAG: replication factor C large subunit [Candidatus Micrarchaeia archaeon]|jgi:replication factor C large subunit